MVSYSRSYLFKRRYLYPFTDRIKNEIFWFGKYLKIRRFFYNIDKEKILLFGYPKSGNTWLRFLLYNYLNLQLDPTKNETITFDQLNNFQNNIMDRGHTNLPSEGYPFFYRTHQINIRIYKLFDKKIFIHRNPLDTLISSYYFYKNRTDPFNGEEHHIKIKYISNINYYVKDKIFEWIDFYNKSIQHADFIVNYSNLMTDDEKVLSDLIVFLGINIDPQKIKRATEFSKFDKIKKMSISHNQIYGNGPKDGSFNGVFNRSGKENQFFSELEPETVRFVLDKFPMFKDLYPNLIE